MTIREISFLIQNHSLFVRTDRTITTTEYSESASAEGVSLDSMKLDERDPLDLVTKIVYTRDGNETVSVDGFNPNNVTLSDVRIANARPKNALLCKNGFQLVDQVTSLSTSEFFEDDAKVKAVYYREIAELVKKHTHAKLVIPFHHQLRSASVPSIPRVSQLGKIRSPAGAAHVDYTAKYAVELFNTICPEEYSRGRFCIVNAWRNISDVNVVSNDHLAVLDPHTIVAPDDFVPHTMANDDGTVSNTYRLEPVGHKRHRWYYYPNMSKNEVLLFTQYDSDVNSKLRFTFHSAVKDPRAPENGPLRESIEMRLLVCYPDHPVDTIPQSIFTDEEFVKAAVKQVLTTLKYPDKWNPQAREWMRSVIHNGPEGVRTAAYGIVVEGAKRGSKAMNGATESQQHRIIEQLIALPEFEQRGKEYFPPL